MALSLLASACSTTRSGVRSWVDEKTAVTVTAQQRAMVFYRDDFQSGVNIYDFADLGAFEINQSGKRSQYLCLLLWSTVARSDEYQSKVEEDFSNLVVWADDQPVTFKRLTQNRDMVHLGDQAFKRSTSNAHESYYEISLAQLATLAAAKTLRISPSNQAAGDSPYNAWRDDHAGLVAFMNEVSNTNRMINQ
ncbi:MAG TPA: hypothetical protein VHL14_12235 [Steroidobacteraceae bacterium]|nr:hypothetical protein [Steroidobacteraceae bacterium]